MAFTDLLRITVLLIGGGATALGAITVVAADQKDGIFTFILAAVWWLAAVIAGSALGREPRVAESMSRALASARTTPTLPSTSPIRIALGRLWPVGAFALVCGGTGVVWPQVAAIGTGYALLIALLWRNREAAVTAVEERDGVRFYVEPSSAFEPVRLIRTPGLGREPKTVGHPPPPPPLES